MNRTYAALAIMVGLTALMVGLYIDDFKTLADALKNYVMLFP